MVDAAGDVATRQDTGALMLRLLAAAELFQRQNDRYTFNSPQCNKNFETRVGQTHYRLMSWKKNFLGINARVIAIRRSIAPVIIGYETRYPLSIEREGASSMMQRRTALTNKQVYTILLLVIIEKKKKQLKSRVSEMTKKLLVILTKKKKSLGGYKKISKATCRIYGEKWIFTIVRNHYYQMVKKYRMKSLYPFGEGSWSIEDIASESVKSNSNRIYEDTEKKPMKYNLRIGISVERVFGTSGICENHWVVQ